MTAGLQFIPDRSVVLVGMMAVGKSAVGRRLAQQLGIAFWDSDTEIEAEAGMSIAQIFETKGEPAFREMERETIARFLEKPMAVISTGGGAFMDPSTRARIAECAISVWLKADPDVLLARTARRNDRPLLWGDNPRERMLSLLAQREPVYATANLKVETDHRPVHETTAKVLQALKDYQQRRGL